MLFTSYLCIYSMQLFCIYPKASEKCYENHYFIPAGQAATAHPPSFLSFLPFRLLNFLTFKGSRGRIDKPGMVQLFSDFESFYTRRFYRRIQDCFNRPICSAPDAWMRVLIRKPVTSPSGTPALTVSEESEQR